MHTHIHTYTSCLSYLQAIVALKLRAELLRLLEYLCRTQLPEEAHLSGGAEHTAHGAPRLGGDARGVPVLGLEWVGVEDRRGGVGEMVGWWYWVSMRLRRTCRGETRALRGDIHSYTHMARTCIHSR